MHTGGLIKIPFEKVNKKKKKSITMCNCANGRETKGLLENCAKV